MIDEDESVNISDKTLSRTINNISKVGYSDGVSDGLNASFQTSFDTGYSQGLTFGLNLGYQFAVEQRLRTCSNKDRPKDPCKINCQICLDQSIISQNVVNLYNRQKEINDNYFIE